MDAVEQYDPEFSAAVPACMAADEAERLLQEWYSQREETVLRTRDALEKAWKAADPGRTAAP